ncbi:MAG: hypothetical protein WKF91_17925 [Segetibacter sp.]
MKKLLPSLILLITVISCNNENSTKTDGDSPNANAPSIIEDTSTQHPNGMTSDGVISTDTAAFGVKANKADEANKKH